MGKTDVCNKKIDSKTVKSVYDTPSCTFVVKSRFSNKTALSELIYQLIAKDTQAKLL